MANLDQQWALTGLGNVSFTVPSPVPEPPITRFGQLTASQLRNQRDQLVQLLEYSWGKIGWHLKRAKTPQQIQALLKPIATEGQYERLLAPFVRATDVPPDLARMRSLWRQMKGVNRKSYKAFERQQPATEALRLAEVALHRCSSANRKRLKKECAKRKRQVRRVNQRCAAVEQERAALGAELENLEAAYAQSELLKLIRSPRHAHVPLRIASGMAGLPYMGWRQSTLRCAKLGCDFANGLWYTTFKKIRDVIQDIPFSKRSAGVIASALTTSIRRMRSKKQRYIQGHLVQNWFFLKRAIRSEYAASSYSKSLPYRITATFQKQLERQMPEDRVFAEMEKLEGKEHVRTKAKRRIAAKPRP